MGSDGSMMRNARGSCVYESGFNEETEFTQ